MPTKCCFFSQVKGYEKIQSESDSLILSDGGTLKNRILAADTSTAKGRRSLISLLCDVLETDKANVCMVFHQDSLQDGVKRCGAFLRYEYSPPMNDLLKTSGRAMFFKAYKAWRLCLDDPESDFTSVNAELGQRFKYLVDLDRGEVCEATEAVHGNVVASAFTPMSYHVMVTTPTVRNACSEWGRDRSMVFDANIEVWNNGAFADIESFPGVFWVNVPFLFLRIKKTGGPRYASYHVLAKTIEMVTYGPASTKTASLFARYLGALDSAGIVQVVETDESRVIKDTPSLRRQYQGDFSRFWESFDYVKYRIKDLQFAPLSSHCVTLFDRGLGGESGIYNDTMAYVWSQDFEPPQLAGLKSYFGYSDAHYSIIFSAGFLDHLDPHFADEYGELGSVNDTLVHELAHHFRVSELLSLFPQGDGYPHDLCWAVCKDVLDNQIAGGDLVSTSSSLKAYAFVTGCRVGSIMVSEIESTLNALSESENHGDGCPEIDHVSSSFRESAVLEQLPVMTVGRILAITAIIVRRIECAGEAAGLTDVAGCEFQAHKLGFDGLVGVNGQPIMKKGVSKPDPDS